MSRTRSTALASIFLVGTLALSGCSLLGGGDGASQQTAGTDSTSQTDGSQGQASDEPGVVAYDESKVVATQEITLPDGVGTANLELYPLEVVGETQVMTAFITPKLVNPEGSVNLYDILGGATYWSPKLIDHEHLKEYKSLESETAPGRWTSGLFEASGGDGQPIPLWAVFAAPQDGATSFDVIIHDAYPTFADIPIQ
ncbi:hypothetical protein [Pseudoclavibacter sp. RFBB5]|uniref:hypothetical protein n=1 Tax=Pseudoclavibacter sp. RFBB5 TaxID=2080574 RepID=UPI000CE7F7C0|nr:hypothetical protein [Pseudoclavibacter sp. RFBB5]PPG27610.1 hypothetical protein C5B97_15670 [Pseudoclavibacter sp. RFBB5]